MQKALEHARQRLIPYLSRSEFRFELAIALVSAALGGFAVGGRVAPLGPAMAAAVAMTRINPLYAGLGAAIGALAAGRYEALIAVGLFFGLEFLWKRWRRQVKRTDRLLLLGVSQLLVLPFFYFSSLEACLYGVGGFAGSVLLTPLLYKGLRVVLHLRLRRLLSSEEQLGLIIALALLGMALSGVSPFGVSLGAVLAVACSLVAVEVKGVQATAIAVAMGAALVLGGGAPLLIIANLAICTLCACVMRELGRFGVAGGYAACSLLIYAYIGATYALPLATLGAGTLIALAVPRRAVEALASATDATRKQMRRNQLGTARLRSSTGKKLTEVSAVLREVAGLYSVSVPDTDRERASTVTAAAMSVCSLCPHSRQCWAREAEAAQTLVDMAEGTGRDMRLPLNERCHRKEPLLIAVRAALEQFDKRMEAERRAWDCMDYTHRQFEGVCSVVGSLAQKTSQPLVYEEALEARLLVQLDRDYIRAREIAVLREQGRIKCELTLADKNKAEAACDSVSRALGKPFRLRLTPRAGEVVLEEAYALDIRFGAAAATAPNSRVSGDCMGARELGDGRLLLVVSDGMGSGADAHRESAAAVALLGDLVSVGFDIGLALESVNRLLIARSGSEMYATLDAMLLDMKDGSTRFVKYGAPPCHILREGKVMTLSCEALPVGILEEALPAVHHLVLQPGDIVVMMTDGAADALGQELVALLCERVDVNHTATEIAQTLVQLVLERAPEDDASVMAVKILGVHPRRRRLQKM